MVSGYLVGLGREDMFIEHVQYCWRELVCIYWVLAGCRVQDYIVNMCSSVTVFTAEKEVLSQWSTARKNERKAS